MLNDLSENVFIYTSFFKEWPCGLSLFLGAYLRQTKQTKFLLSCCLPYSRDALACEQSRASVFSPKKHRKCSPILSCKTGLLELRNILLLTHNPGREVDPLTGLLLIAIFYFSPMRVISSTISPITYLESMSKIMPLTNRKFQGQERGSCQSAEATTLLSRETFVPPPSWPL